MLLLCALVAVVFSSCRTVKEIEYRDFYIHDTVTLKEVVHDSIEKIVQKHDSIDHYIEKYIYVDENGVVHEREIERLTQYIRESEAEFHQRESEYKERIAELERLLSENQTVVEVKKPLNWFQKTMVGLGVCFIITVAVYLIRMYIKLKTGIKKYG